MTDYTKNPLNFSPSDSIKLAKHSGKLWDCLRLCPRRRMDRQGSALLICTLAATVLSMAMIAVLRCNRQAITKVEAVRVSCQNQNVADGLMQRGIAMVRLNPRQSGVVKDEWNANSQAFIEFQTRSANETLIQVFLYPGSSIPAAQRVVDPSALAGSRSVGEPSKLPASPISKAEYIRSLGDGDQMERRIIEGFRPTTAR